MFAELPKHVAVNIEGNIMVIPTGTYFCTRSAENQIEQALKSLMSIHGVKKPSWQSKLIFLPVSIESTNQ